MKRASGIYIETPVPEDTLAGQVRETVFRAVRVMEIDICGIWIKDSFGSFRPQIYYGIDKDFANFLFANAKHNVVKHILKSKNPFQIRKLSNYNGGNFHDFVKKVKIKSFLACPIIVKDKRVGIIAVCTKKKYYRFTNSDKIILSTLANGIAFSIRNEDLSTKVKNDYLNTIKSISHILEANDQYTYGHSNKVMLHCIQMCRILKLKREKTYLIKNAALLHDIGKVGVPVEILKKKARLTKKEWQEIKKHPVLGAKLIEQTGFLNELAPIIKHHHAKYIGGGYPDPSLTHDKIPLGAKIITIADSYDAMTSKRPYRGRPYSPKKAVAEIKRNAGKQFDPDLSKIFLNHVVKNGNSEI